MLTLNREYKLFGGAFGVVTSSFCAFSEDGVIDEKAIKDAIKEVERTRRRAGSQVKKAPKGKLLFRERNSFLDKPLLDDSQGCGAARLEAGSKGSQHRLRKN
jgi:hypothetical protein